MKKQEINLYSITDDSHAFSRLMQSKLSRRWTVPAFISFLVYSLRARMRMFYARRTGAIRALDACRRLINGWTETKQVEPVGVPAS